MSVIKSALQNPELIAYLSGANNYSWLYFQNGEKKLLAKPISYLEQLLPGFVRVHKTALINPSFIQSLYQPPRKKMTGKVYLKNGETFPVSRRRWNQIVESLKNYSALTMTQNGHSEAEPLPLLPQEEAERQRSASSLFLITDNEQDRLTTEQIIHEKWPAYLLHTTQQSTFLPDLLKQLPEQEYPALLLLDARTTTLERLNTLQRLKTDTQLTRLPVILLVLPSEQQVLNGYQHQANSVVAIPENYALFGQLIERICQFWLRMVALPGGVSKVNP